MMLFSKHSLPKILAILVAAVMLPGQFPALHIFAAEESAAVGDTFESNGIPVLNINIDETTGPTIEEMNASPDHSVECKGSISIDVPDGYTGAYSSEVLADLTDLKLDYIRGRGNSTWQADKKPYRLKLDKSTDLLGMGKNKHWALLANRFDQSLLRNRLAVYMGEQLGLAYTPKMLPVDVVMNGEYLGSYLLAQSIRVDKTRIEIDELKPEDNQEPNITGGYLLALKGNHDDDPEDTTIVTEKGMKFIAETPSFDFSENADESGSKEQKAYISDYLQKVENAIFGENFCDENGVSYKEYMDLQSTADYWWVQIFSNSYDAFRTSSTYLYKGRNDKLYWGPLWDFDLTLGNGASEGVEFNIGAENAWLDHIRAYDPEYLALLKERWAVLDGIVGDILKDGGVLDTYAAEIAESWKDNAAKWGEWIASVKPLIDLEAEVKDLKLWLTSQRDWVNTHLDLLNHVYYTITFTADDAVVSTVTLRVGKDLSELPQAPIKEGYTFTGWMDENGEIVDSVSATHDTELKAQYSADSGSAGESSVEEAAESSASEAESSSAQESPPASDSSHAESGSAVSESSASESIPSKSSSTSATVWILIGLAVVAAAGAGSMVYFKKKK